MPFIVLILLMVFAMASTAAADEIEGRLVSIDAQSRQVTLDGGEVMKLLAPVPIESLAIGQLVRLDYEVGTVDVSSVVVLELPQPPPLSEEPVEVVE